MIQTTLLGVNLQVIEQVAPDGTLFRVLSATEPSGNVWVIPMDVLVATRIGGQLSGRVLVVAPANGKGA